MFVLPQFSNFKHIFFALEFDLFDKCSESDAMADEISEKLEKYYWQCLKHLGNEDHKLDLNYNLILTRNFMWVVLRKDEGYKEEHMTVTVNSLGFIGTLAVKREDDLKLIKSHGPIGILEKVTFPSHTDTLH